MTEFQRRLELNIRESLRFAVGEVQDDAVAHMMAGVNAVLNHPCAPPPQEHVAAWRYRPNETAVWQYAEGAKPVLSGWIVEPLYARPPSPQPREVGSDQRAPVR